MQYTLPGRFDELGDKLALIYQLNHQVSPDNADSFGNTAGSYGNT